MDTDVALFWVQESMRIAFLITGPLLGTALVVGVAVSLFQAVTSIQEQTLASVPKMLVTGVVALALAPWMLQLLVDFVTATMQYIPSVAR